MTDADSIKSILILDDDMDFRLLLKTILRKYFQNAVFHEYDPVALGAPAEDYDWSPYDVLILDYYLCVHRLTGLDLLQKHRKRPGFPAAIMLTGAGTEETAVRAVKFGAYEYLRKEKLDKAVLAASILAAYNKHADERIKRDEAEKARSVFDKSSFYRQLEQPAHEDPATPARVFLLFDIDNYSSLTASLGPIGSDNFGRDLARLIYEHPSIKQANPCITRLGESAVGVLIDAPADHSALEQFLENLCRYLAEKPYQLSGNTIPWTFSIGAVEPQGASTVEMLLQQVNSARNLARDVSGNSFHIYAEGDVKSEKHTAPVLATKPGPVRPVTDIPLEDDEEGLAVDQIPAAQETVPVVQVVPEPVTVVPAGKQAQPEPLPAKVSGSGKETVAVSGDKKSADTIKAAVDEKTEEHVQGQTGEQPEIYESELGEHSLIIKKAFDDNRVVQTFQPVIAMFSGGAGDAHELFKVDIQLIDLHGKVMSATELRAHLSSLALQKFIDRWMLRQLLGRIVHTARKENRKRYQLPITEAWFTDITLFDWLKKLLAGQEDNRPGRFIVLEISAGLFARYQERVMILTKTLRKTYGFKTALGSFVDINEAVKMARILKPDLFVLDYSLLSMLKGVATPAGNDMNLLNSLKSAGTQIIISGVESATILTEVISAGADYVYGNFIGEPQINADEASNVESFSLG